MIYIAGPWFNERQNKILQDVKIYLRDLALEFYSPKDDNLFQTDLTSPTEIFDDNVKHMLTCDMMLVITDGKDVGTIFEAGFAYAQGKQILYLWVDYKEGQKFNIMLAESGDSCCLGFLDLQKALIQYKETGTLKKIEYTGALE